MNLKYLCRAGGVYSITDVNRKQSVFELYPDYVNEMIDNIEKYGSKLGHVNAVCSWSTNEPQGYVYTPP